MINDVTPFIELEKLRQQFVTMVSHELRTPITAINLSLNNLINYREKLDEEQLDKILAIMQRNGDLLSTMVEDLLIAARIEAAPLDLEKVICNLSDIIHEIHQELENQFKEKNLTLQVEIDSNIEIRADLKRISQVFRIIIDNAVKYSPIGSEIRIQAIENYQDPENPKGVPGVLIKFIDQGIGIPKKDLPKLFQRFHRGSNIGNIGGSGVGLNIAKTLVELHAGTISVESQKGLGSIFAVFLPK
jgi:signal transduction histidine kinase